MVASGGEDLTIWLIFGFVVRFLFFLRIKMQFDLFFCLFIFTNHSSILGTEDGEGNNLLLGVCRW